MGDGGGCAGLAAAWRQGRLHHCGCGGETPEQQGQMNS